MNRRTFLLIVFSVTLPLLADAAREGWVPLIVVAIQLLPIVGFCIALAAVDRRHERMRQEWRAMLPAPEAAAAEGSVSVTDAAAGGEVSVAREGGEVSDP